MEVFTILRIISQCAFTRSAFKNKISLLPASNNVSLLVHVPHLSHWLFPYCLGTDSNIRPYPICFRYTAPFFTASLHTLSLSYPLCCQSSPFTLLASFFRVHHRRSGGWTLCQVFQFYYHHIFEIYFFEIDDVGSLLLLLEFSN